MENITEKLNPLTIAIHSWLFAISRECLYTESSDYTCSYMTVCSLLKMKIKPERFSCMKGMSMFSVMWQWINEDYAQLGLAYVHPVRKILFLCNDRTDISLECWKDWYSCSPE